MGCSSSTVVGQAIGRARRGGRQAPTSLDDVLLEPADRASDRYPDFIKLVFEDRALLADGSAFSQELGTRFAKACADLAAKLEVDAASLAEAYTDPQVRDAKGQKLDFANLASAKWPVTLEFPKQRRQHNLVVGLPGAGKTTLLRRLMTTSGKGQIRARVAGGLGVEVLELDDFVSFVAWDLPGPNGAQALRCQFFKDAMSLIFVVDSSDRDSMESARALLQGMLSEKELQRVAVLVYANKQDMPDALSAKEVSTCLGVGDLTSHRWWIQPCSAAVGDGIFHGINWLSQTVSAMKEETKTSGCEEDSSVQQKTVLNC
mmetsp:Transcript_17356/g.31609  ORF Transcript_17356/g.31609 Transcript_17356/m.31609 type:complete len:317 (+) Transcript_17356:61-1011(+)